MGEITGCVVVWKGLFPEKNVQSSLSKLTILNCGYFFASRMHTWLAMNPAPPVTKMFFGINSALASSSAAAVSATWAAIALRID